MAQGKDYTDARNSQEHNQLVANLFETGNRHPKWRGGIDPQTQKNRQKQYAKHGIGFMTGTNSQAAQGTARSSNRFVGFVHGRVDHVKISGISSRGQVSELLSRAFDKKVVDTIEESLYRNLNCEAKVEYYRYHAKLDIDEDTQKYTLTLNRFLIKKKPKKIENRKTTSSAKNKLLKKKARVFTPHKNTIRGLERLQ